MQMGSGGASLATARFLRQKMIDQNIHCRFALGGMKLYLYYYSDTYFLYRCESFFH